MNKPAKIYEYKDVHYFYWPVELGIGKIKIWKLKIPTFPIKYLDYEPVKVISYKDNLVILSRFHYHILTYFNKPKLKDNKPMVDFSFGSHSPMVYTDISTNTDHGYNEHFPSGIDAREIDAFYFLLGIFNAIIKGKLNFEVENVTTYDLSTGEAPKTAFLGKATSKTPVCVLYLLRS